MAQNKNHYHQAFSRLKIRPSKIVTHFLWWCMIARSQSQDTSNCYENDLLVDLFLGALTGINSPCSLVQHSVFETQHAAGTSLLFTNVEKSFISLEECSVHDMLTSCHSHSLEGGANAVGLNPNPLAHSNHINGQSHQDWGKNQHK